MTKTIESSSVSLKALHSDEGFKRFVKHMLEADRAFPLNAKKKDRSTKKEMVAATDPKMHEVWLDCCFREYIRRKKTSASNFTQNRLIYLWGLFIVLFVSLLLYYIWPIWSFLIDTDTRLYYKTLGLDFGADSNAVTKAYRTHIRRWHPDSNPNCGAYCRIQLEKVKHAYHGLLQVKQNYDYFVNQYLNGLLQLRSLVFFRMYALSSNAAEEIFNLLFQKTKIFSEESSRPHFIMLSRLLIVVLFIAYEVLCDVGFDIVLLSEAFFIVRGSKLSTKEIICMNTKRLEYIDLFGEALCMLIPAISIHFVCIHFQVLSFNWMEEALRAAMGSIYIAAYLDRFVPNLFDNFKNRRCKVFTMDHDSNGPRLRKFSLFVKDLIVFLVSDIFIFTFRVPNIYRIVVFASHTLYLLEYFLLPTYIPELRLPEQWRSETTSDSIADNSKGDCGNPRTGDPTKSLKRAVNKLEEVTIGEELSPDDVKLLSNLDREPICWMDVPRSKYNYVIALMIDKLLDIKGTAITVNLTCTCDLKNIEFFCFDRQSHTAYSIFFQPDPSMARLIGHERGPFRSAPSNDKERSDAKLLEESFLRSMGPDSKLTASEAWRRGKNIPPTHPPLGQNMFELFFFTISFCILGLFVHLLLKMGPDPTEILDTLRFTPPSMQPLRHSRFINFLPKNHPLNTANVGLATLCASRYVFFVPDFWDSYRQLLFYAS